MDIFLLIIIPIGCIALWEKLQQIGAQNYVRQEKQSANKDCEKKVVSLVLDIDEYCAFKEYAEQHGKTISAMLLELVKKCISETGYLNK